MKKTSRPVVCFFTGSAGDWGGASRALYTNLRQLDLEQIDPLILLPRDGPIVPELEQRGLRYRIWGSLAEPSSPVRYLRAFARALAMFRREKASLVHFNLKPWRPAEALAARALGIPILLHYHMVNGAESPTDRLARAACAVSEFVRRESKPGELEKFVTYNSVELSRFSKGTSRKAEMGIEPEKVVVTFLGQIRDIKGVQDFIAMARSINRTDVAFIIAGRCRDPKKNPGSYTEDDLRRMIGGDERIRYVGYIERVEDIYMTSDIVVAPSRWQEPFGLIAIEAAACRKPVVATRVGGLPEIIESGATGYLVEPMDTQALAEHVEQLIDDQVLRERFGEAAYQRVSREFTTGPARQFQDILLRLARA